MLDLLPRDTFNSFPHQLYALIATFFLLNSVTGTGWANNCVNRDFCERLKIGKLDAEEKREV